MYIYAILIHNRKYGILKYNKNNRDGTTYDRNKLYHNYLFLLLLNYQENLNTTITV